MWRIMMLLVAAAVAITLLPSSLEAAVTHEGRVVSAGSGRITIIDKNGENEKFDVADDARITRNGNAANLGDVEEGDVVKVTVAERNGKPVAVVIEAKVSE